MLTYFPGSRLPSQFPDSHRHSPSLAQGFCGQIPGNSPVLAPTGEISPPVLLYPCSRLSFLLCSPCQPRWGLLQGWNALCSQMPSSSWFLQLQVWLLFSNYLAGFKCISSCPEDTYDFLPLLKTNQTLPVSRLHMPRVEYTTTCQLRPSRSVPPWLLLCSLLQFGLSVSTKGLCAKGQPVGLSGIDEALRRQVAL